MSDAASQGAGPPTARSLEGASPVMAQFLTLKAQFPDHLLFFRMGDFYELFFEDAGVAAAALGIALTKRGRHGDEEIAMCGVPHHQAERYLHDLIRKGFKVAVAEQLEDPAEARKRGSKAVVKRDVVRLVTPGTLSEDALLSAESSNYLAAIALRAEKAGVAWADLSTGVFEVTTVARAELPATLARLSPAEALLAAPADPDLARLVRDGGGVATEVDPRGFQAKRAAQRVAALFGAASIDAFGAFSAEETGAMGALAAYLELTQRGAPPSLRPPRRETASSHLRIDAATRRNLELTRGPDGGRAGSLLAEIDRTRTNAGARLLAARLSAPATDVAEITARHEAVAWAVAERAFRGDARALLKTVPDIERAAARLALGRGGPRDIGAVRDALTAADALAQIFAKAQRDVGAPARLTDAAAALTGLCNLNTRLAEALVAAPPTRVADGGAVADGFDRDLDEARALRDTSREVIAALQRDYQSETQIAALKIKHNSVLGYFVETPATHAERMMSPPLSDTFRHRQTTANAVRFSTVTLAELEGKITRSADRALALETEIVAALTDAVNTAREPLTALADAMAELDLTLALAELADAENWCRPIVDASGAFRIDGGRHPVVEAALRREEGQSFVANDCDLSRTDPAGGGETPIWLVTGPNMAGKSTFLRQNALMVVLAQMGAFTPAERAEIGVVDQLFSRVGAADDLARGRSTFMVEMVETAAILNQSGPRSLVVLDEIGRGTATYDGLAIAWATLEHLHGVNGCRTLFATHYHELTALATALPGLRNVTVSVREWKGDVVFLREIKAGAADRSYGVQVAKLAGLPKAVTSRAKTLLTALERGDDGPAARAKRLAEDLPLFAATTAEPAESPAASPALARLADLNPDALSPRAALDALYELKSLLNAEEDP